MIEIHKDQAGNVTGFWDTDNHCWVPPTESYLRAAELDNNDKNDPNDEPPAADADDTNEPEPEEDVKDMEDIDYDSWTKDQLKKKLDDLGVTYSSNATKDTLISILTGEA